MRLEWYQDLTPFEHFATYPDLGVHLASPSRRTFCSIFSKPIYGIETKPLRFYVAFLLWFREPVLKTPGAEARANAGGSKWGLEAPGTTTIVQGWEGGTTQTTNRRDGLVQLASSLLSSPTGWSQNRFWCFEPETGPGRSEPSQPETGGHRR